MSDSGEKKDLTAHPSHPLSTEISREALIEHIILQEQYAGPVAHPHIAKGWDQALPGSASRILAMAEEQQRHRIQQEKDGQAAAITRDKRGMDRGTLLALALMALSA